MMDAVTPIAPGITITVRYSCTLCAVRDRALAVLARSETESVKLWLDRTILRIGNDHRAQHPDCLATHLHDLKIPIDNVDRLGGPAIS